MTISREDVLRVAELAHLELTPEEIELYRGQLDEILAYIGKLEKLDVSNVEPMAQVLFAVAPGEDHPETPRRHAGSVRRRRSRPRAGPRRGQALLPRPKGDRAVSEILENER